MQPPIHAKKEGNVYTVYVDMATSRALPLASFSDEPAGGFGLTFNSIRELQAHFPGCQIEFVERARKTPPTLSGEAVLTDQVDSFLASKTHTPQPTKPPTAQPKLGDSHTKATAFLRELETALQYASKKHAKTLAIKVEVVRELINAIF